MFALAICAPNVLHVVSDDDVGVEDCISVVLHAWGRKIVGHVEDNPSSLPDEIRVDARHRQSKTVARFIEGLAYMFVAFYRCCDKAGLRTPLTPLGDPTR